MKYTPEQQNVLTRIASNVGQITFLSKALRRPEAEADKALLRSRRHFCARYLLEAAEEALGMGFRVRRMDEYRQWAAGNYPWG